MTALGALWPWAEAALASGIGVFVRVAAAMFLLPVFGESAVPLRVKLGLAVAFTAIVAPAAPDLPAPTTQWFLTEAAIGLMLGLALRLMVMALRIAGTIAAQATSLSQLLGGAAGEPQPAISQALVVSGLALAVLLGLHVEVAALFIRSYDILPAGSLPAAEGAAEWAIGAIGFAFALAVQLALPFVAASMVYNLALGVINRAMPQLMVAFVGAPAITMGALVLMALTTPLLLTVWADALAGRLADPFGAP